MTCRKEFIKLDEGFSFGQCTVYVVAVFSSALGMLKVDYDGDIEQYTIKENETLNFPWARYPFSIHAISIFDSATVDGIQIEVCDIVSKGSIDCISEPSGAKIYMDGNYTGRYTRYLLTDVEPGSHRIDYYLTGYDDCGVNVNVPTGGSTIAHCSLDKSVGSIRCQAYDSATNAALTANIYLDGTNINQTTPFTITDVIPGYHTVTFSLDGYESDNDTVNVVAGERVDAYGSMNVETVIVDVHVYDQNNTNVVGAQVCIPDAEGAKCIATNLSGIATGFTLKKYGSFIATVTPPNGYSSNMDSSKSFVSNNSGMIALVLTKDPVAGSIRCQAYDSATNAALAAVIYLDNTRLNFLTPHTIENVNPGTHTVTFVCEGLGSCDGYESDNDTVNVVAGERVDAYGNMVEIIEEIILDVSVIDQNNEPVASANVTIPGALGATTIATNYNGVAVGFTLEKNKDYTGGVTPPTGYIVDDGSSKTFVATGVGYLLLTLTKIVEEDIFTSLIIGLIPSEIGVDQYSTISGGLHIENAGLILPGIPIKLYIDKGQGFEHIATSNTPSDGTGQFEYEYKATPSDADKALKFRWVYEGSDTLKLKPSESATKELNIKSEPILIETELELSASPATNVAPTTIVQLTAYLTDIDNNMMPEGSLVSFYKDNELIITTETKNGYAYCNYQSEIEDSLKTISFSVEYLGIENKYDISEDTINVTFAEYIPLKNCADYLTQTDCEDNGCYWYNERCNDVPEDTTEYFDVHIKPYSFYVGNYAEALNKTITLTTNLNGAIANYISSVTGYVYNGMDILEDQNKEIIVIRVYLENTDETSLVPPLIIGAVVGIIAGILLFSIGYITGTSETEYTREEVITLIDDSSDKAIEACKERYPNRTTDVNEAANYKHCVGGIETVRIIGSADVIEEDSSEHINFVIDPKIIELDSALDDETLLPENIDDAIKDNITDPTKDVVDEYKETAMDQDCAFELFGECLITKKAAKTLVVVGGALAGLAVVSGIKGIIK